jgi:hypothetical protein
MKAIRTERELLSYLRKLHEQVSEPPSDAPAPPPVPPSATAPTAPQAPTQPITVEDIIEKINVVRSGRSTKDSNVKSELEQYVNQFDEDEKTALIAFLEGLGQILTSGVDSVDAVDPRDPYALQIKKSEGSVPSTAVKPPTQVASPAPAPTPGPVPIKIGG